MASGPTGSTPARDHGLNDGSRKPGRAVRAFDWAQAVASVVASSSESSVRWSTSALSACSSRATIPARNESPEPIGLSTSLAASGVKDFGKLLGRVADAAPLRRNVTIDDVGNVAAFLLSNLASGVTAEITYVDAGFSQTAGLSADQV